MSLWLLAALIVGFLRLGSRSDIMVGEACANDGGDSRGGHTAGMKSLFRTALCAATGGEDSIGFCLASIWISVSVVVGRIVYTSRVSRVSSRTEVRRQRYITNNQPWTETEP